MRTLVYRPDRGEGGKNLRGGQCKHNREQKSALPLTCWCSCCWRLLFHLCVVIPAARWDGSTATSSPNNYFAGNHNRFPDILQESLISTMSRVPQRSLDPLSASPVRKNACLLGGVGGYSRSRTAPSCPRMIGHIAAAVRIPIESCGVIPESDARGVCV